jgi:hypothetical protein
MLNGNKVVVVMPAYNAARTLERPYREIPRDIAGRSSIIPAIGATIEGWKGKDASGPGQSRARAVRIKSSTTTGECALA